MTSAYGGIRWSSGMVRAFQYEDGQSRIGKDLWSDLDAYIKNSPLFYADKVNTPLLMMHNDEDGAVPWYQGIEYFTALRRLQKPVWMLVYNGAPHNLSRFADTQDLTVRLEQFFDHFLMGAPEPKWMREGVKAIDKGREFGFGY
jgi:dipeptidyl aminopeptidase/acylaminoacyl peptidase